MVLTEEQKAENRRLSMLAIENARKTLKPGDRIRVTKCPGTRRWVTFAGWDGLWIVSKSGIDDFSARCIDRLNDLPVDFTQPAPHAPLAEVVPIRRNRRSANT